MKKKLEGVQLKENYKKKEKMGKNPIKKVKIRDKRKI